MCHCACCGTTVVINAIAQIDFNTVEIVKNNPIFSEEIPTNISSSIWQPPKIA
jgi:hypothetical protein